MKRLIRDIKLPSFLLLRDMLTVNLFGGKQFKQGHLSIGSLKWILMEVIFSGKNVLSVLREWKKPYVKTSVFHDIHKKSHV